MVDVLAAPQQAKADSSLRTLVAISIAHWVSHFHLFVLPMLFPFLKEQLGVGYIELGFALTVFGVVSGLTQAPIGYLADHIGARKVLLIGLTVGGLALIMLGMHLSYPWLIASAALLGLANSVYHPADYAILSAHMDVRRMGRAFSIHTFAGFLGGAVAPVIMASLVAVVGGLGALIVAGAVGPLVALLLIVVGIPDASSADRKRRPPPSLARLEQLAALGVASSFDLQYRLLPPLRSIAGGLLASRRRVELDEDTETARRILGDETWDLVRSGRPAPQDRVSRGLSPEGLTRVVDSLERV